MAVSAGYMRKRIKLMGLPRNFVGSIHRDSVGQIIGERQVLARPWCSVKVVSSSENVSSSATRAHLTLEFTVRYSKQLSNPTPDLEIIYEQDTYDIVSVINPSMKNEKLIVTAVKRG